MRHHGLVIPLTPTGQSTAVLEPPWHYGGEVIQLEFHVSPSTFESFVPLPLVPADSNPFCVQVAFCRMAAVAAGNLDQYYLEPNESNFDECLIKLLVRLGQQVGWFVSHCWVTNDASLLRGIVQGFPKRYGFVHMTHFDSLQERVGGRRLNAHLGAQLVTPNGFRLHVTHRCLARSGPDALLSYPFLLRRHFPALDPPYSGLVDEIVSPTVEGSEVDELWIGDGTLAVSGQDAEVASLLNAIDEPISRSFRTCSTITGNTVLCRVPK